MFMFFNTLRSSSDTTALEYQRLSAGTRYRAPARCSYARTRPACGHVVIPTGTRFKVAGVELPIFGRIFQPAEEMLLLLFFAHHKEYFDDGTSVRNQLRFESVDFVISRLPYLFRIGFVNARHDDIFIVRSIENGDPTILRQFPFDAATNNRGPFPRLWEHRNRDNACPSDRPG